MTPATRHRSPAIIGTWAIVIVAAAIRLAYVSWYPQVEPLCPDCELYDRVAINLADGRGLVDDSAEARALGVAGPVINFGPIYPAMLAAIYHTVGHRSDAVRIVQALLGVLMIPLMWRLGTQAFGPAGARAGGWLLALSPALVIYSGMLLTETLSTALLVCALWLFAAAATRSSPAWFIAAGVTTGALILLREEMLTIPIGIAIVLVWKRGHGVRPRHFAAYLLAVAVAVGCWTVRNYLIFHRPILVTTKGGEQLWISAKGWSEWQFTDPGYRDVVRGRQGVEREQALRSDALRMIAAAPGQYLVRSVKRLPELWISSHTSYLRGLSDSFRTYLSRGAYFRLTAKLALLAIQLALLGLAAAGLAHTARAPTGFSFSAALIVVPIIAITFVHFFLFATPRYQIPALPFVAAFAGAWLAGSSHPKNGQPERFEGIDRLNRVNDPPDGSVRTAHEQRPA